MKFSEIMWDKVREVYLAILVHPFNGEMLKGTLEEEKFIYYLKQDYYFFLTLERCFILLSKHKNANSTAWDFINLAQGAIKARESVARLLEKRNADKKIKISFACLAYNNYLLRLCLLENIELSVAAILPCYRIYRELGNYIAGIEISDNKFSEWISKYPRGNFSPSLLKLTEIFDCLAHCAPKNLQSLMAEEFYTSCVLEWHFCNDAYNLRDYDKLTS